MQEIKIFISEKRKKEKNRDQIDPRNKRTIQIDSIRQQSKMKSTRQEFFKFIKNLLCSV